MNKENTCQKQAKYVPKETLAEKEMKMNDIALHVFKKKDVKEKIQNVQRRLRNKVMYVSGTWSEKRKKILKEIDKIFNEEIGEGLLKNVF